MNSHIGLVPVPCIPTRQTDNHAELEASHKGSSEIVKTFLHNTYVYVSIKTHVYKSAKVGSRGRGREGVQEEV